MERRAAPILAADFKVPSRTDISPRLLVGAGLFGWLGTGYCPGPAL